MELVKNKRIDELEAAMLTSFDTVDCPLVHRFVPGMYIREIFMPKGSLITSLIHKTKHPFFVLKGTVSVYSENDGQQLFQAGDKGITIPGTRRVLFILEDCVWVTCHATSVQPKDDSPQAILDAVKIIEDEIIEKHTNELLGGVIKNNVLTQTNQLCHF